MERTESVRFESFAEKFPEPRVALDWTRVRLLSSESNECVEVVLAWGDSVLSLRHVGARETVTIGARAGSTFLIPDGVLGEESLSIAPDELGIVRVAFPRGVSGSYKLEDGTELSLAELSNQRDIGGLPMASGSTLRFFLGDFVLTLRATSRERAFPKAPLGGFDRSTFAYFGASASMFGGLIAALAYFVPPLGLSDEVAIEKERLVDLARYMSAIAEKERERENESPSEADTASPSGGNTAAAPGAAGAAGTPRPKMAPGRAALAGEKSNEYRPSRESLLEDVRNSALIGLLRGAAAGLDVPLFERDKALGPDDISARGTLWGADIGETVGSGLALAGLEEGGGFRGNWVGGATNFFGNSLGTGCQGSNCRGGIGVSGGTGNLQHNVKSPKVSMPNDGTTIGTLPAEVIRRTVRQNFARFRFCYERGLAKNPSLEGRVSMRFVIGRDGSISNVGVGQTDLPDSGVNSCLVQAFYGISFPAPSDGIVRVTYPIVFSPE